jgi:hypothetical protein
MLITRLSRQRANADYRGGVRRHRGADARVVMDDRCVGRRIRRRPRQCSLLRRRVGQPRTRRGSGCLGLIGLADCDDLAVAGLEADRYLPALSGYTSNLPAIVPSFYSAAPRGYGTPLVPDSNSRTQRQPRGSRRLHGVRWAHAGPTRALRMPVPELTSALTVGRVHELFRLLLRHVDLAGVLPAALFVDDINGLVDGALGRVLVLGQHGLRLA